MVDQGSITGVVTSTEKILALLGLNISLTALERWATHMEPIFRAFVPLGQFAIAVVTVYYIWTKTRAMKESKRRHRKHKHD